MAEKKEEMKRRDFLFKAAEAAALALFGGMGLAEVTKAITEEIKERNAINRLASQTTKTFIRILQGWCGRNTCDTYRCDDNSSFDCAQEFTCEIRFRCVTDFKCRTKFSCPNEDTCERKFECTRAVSR